MHPSLWVRESAPLQRSAASQPSSADIVVIGGGIAGVATTLALARQGIDVVLLEAGSIACRASGRNDGQMLLGLGEHYNRIVGQFGEERARVLWDFIRCNNSRLKQDLEDLGVACSFRPAGGLRLAETEHENEELATAAALMSEEGFEHQLLDRAEVEAKLPDSRDFFGALYLPGEACVQPTQMVRGLAAEAIQRGATIVEQTAATQITGRAGAFEVHTASGTVTRCSVVVHCTSTLARDVEPTGFLERQMFPFRGQIIATDPLPESTADRFGPCAMSSNFCYEYFRVHDNRFVIGGKRWSVKGEELEILDDASHNEAISANLIEYARRHFPVLQDVEFPQVWTGIMAGTKDGLPLLGAIPGQTGVFALCGFNGYGLSFAYYAGIALAEQILTGQAEHAGVPLFDPRRLLES